MKNELTTPAQEIVPWTSGEFDLSALFRNEVRILNREQILDDISRELQRARKCFVSRFIVVVIDVQEKTGESDRARPTGSVMKAAAERISPLLSPRDALSNLGDGRIAILADTAAHYESADHFAQDIQREISSGVMVEEREVSLVTSAGVASVTAAPMTPDEILSQATIAMQRAQSSGDGQVVIFHSWMAENEIAVAPEQA